MSPIFFFEFLDALSDNITTNDFINKTESLGCPPSQEWCAYTPALTLTQFIISYALTSMGYPTGLALIQSLISKVLGPRPQVKYWFIIIIIIIIIIYKLINDLKTFLGNMDGCNGWNRLFG